MKKGKVIFLNGTSSSGKSSLALKLQELSKKKFYHVQIENKQNAFKKIHQKYM